jgi:hypothetical protein
MSLLSASAKTGTARSRIIFLVPVIRSVNRIVSRLECYTHTPANPLLLYELFDLQISYRFPELFELDRQRRPSSKASCLLTHPSKTLKPLGLPSLTKQTRNPPSPSQRLSNPTGDPEEVSSLTWVISSLPFSFSKSDVPPLLCL